MAAAREWKHPSGDQEEDRKGHVSLTSEIKLSLIQEWNFRKCEVLGSGRVLGIELSGHFPLKCSVGV